jgi:hypothetical protein
MGFETAAVTHQSTRSGHVYHVHILSGNNRPIIDHEVQTIGLLFLKAWRFDNWCSEIVVLALFGNLHVGYSLGKRIGDLCGPRHECEVYIETLFAFSFSLGLDTCSVHEGVCALALGVFVCGSGNGIAMDI